MNQVAINYLEQLRSGGPWQVLAFDPSKDYGDDPVGVITTSDADVARNFIGKHNGQNNLYYSLNPLRRPMTKKAKKIDIARIEFVHADLDPNEGEQQAVAKARYLEALKDYERAATGTIDSGNGIQALWRLKEPIDISGWEPVNGKLHPEALKLVKAVEVRSKAIMEALGCDDTSTFNIDRILRLPGTTNVPNKKKLKKGYVAVESELISFNGAAYELKDFPAPAGDKKTQEKHAGPGRPEGKTLSKSLISILCLPDAGAKAPVGGYQDRSSALFGFLRLALKEGIDDEDIVSHIDNAKYEGCAIYEHCRENGGEKYIREQIAHASNNPDPDAPEGQRLVTIKTRGGGLRDEAKATEQALLNAHCQVYYRGGVLVEPIWRLEKFIDSKKRERQTLSVILRKLTVPQLRFMVAKHIRYQKRDRRRGQWDRINPPIEVMEMVLSLGHWAFPAIKGIINSPTMREDGSLLTEQGYDKQTGLWYMSTSDLKLPDIPERPTRDDAIAAGKLLEELLSEFPFENDGSRAVAMAGMITPVLRGAFDAAPAFLFVAPEAGTGKTYIIILFSTIATGRLPVSIAAVDNKEEMEKRLSAVAFAARPITSINNLDFNLESSLLNQMITEGIVGIRPFGKNTEVVDCNTWASTTFINGNNITVVGDLVRRTLKCKMNAGMEDPESRKFDFDPVELVKADRGKYLAAIFTIVRAYREAGSPPVDAQPLGGFDGWSDFVRNPLIWLGYADPVASIAELRKDDPARAGLRLRIEALLKIFGTEKVFTALEVFNKTQETIPSVAHGGAPVRRYPELFEAFTVERASMFERGSQMNSKTIGTQLKKDLNRIVNGYHIEFEHDPKTGNRYWLAGEPPVKLESEKIM